MTDFREMVAFIKWLGLFEVSTNDTNLILINSLDDAYIDLMDDGRFCVTVENQSEVFTRFPDAAVFLWAKHSCDGVLEMLA